MIALAEPPMVELKKTQEVPELLERHVRERTAGRIQNLQLEQSSHWLILTGRCDSFYAKQLAQEAAREVAPDCRVLNEILVVR